MECIFCKIVNGAIPSYKVWEDDKTLAFLTIRPHKDGHILLIPKKHDEYLFDLDDESFNELMRKTKPLAKALKEIYKPKSGKVSLVVMGMEVPHVHLHLFPLDQETDVNTDKAYEATKEQLSENMERIKSALQAKL